MTRLGRGWLLTKESWGIVRGDRTLLVFPVVAGYAGLIVAAIFIGVAVILRSYVASDALMIAVLVVGAYVLAVVSIFCNVALSYCAARSLEGHDSTTSEGFAAARERFRLILGWALVQIMVGALISLVQALIEEAAGGIIARVVGSFANLAWGAASFFVLPIIALEGLGPSDALKRSTEIIRARWGEGVAGSAAIGGLLALLVFLPGAAMIFAGVALRIRPPAIAIALIVIGVVVIVVGVVVQTAITATFRVALYRFATEDKVLGGFEREPLESAFAPRARRLARI
jgi:Family of unknown function (DUF6159)